MCFKPCPLSLRFATPASPPQMEATVSIRRRSRKLPTEAPTVTAPFSPFGELNSFSVPPSSSSSWRSAPSPSSFSHLQAKFLDGLEASPFFFGFFYIKKSNGVKNKKSVRQEVGELLGGYTVLINTWKQNSLLKQAVAHYASCRSADEIHVVWNDSEPPSEMLKTYLNKIAILKSQRAHKSNFRFDINTEDKSNSRFKPIKDPRTDAIFSVDDDVIVPCPTLDFAFSVWQSAPFTMVGFVPRMHWLDKEMMKMSTSLIGYIRMVQLPFGGGGKIMFAYYRYGGWWSVWWMGTYSMVLSKAAFFHRKYLDLYTHEMSPSIQDYVSRDRNCEDIAMSLLVSNATGGPPIWVKGKIYEIGASGISSLRGHSQRRNTCLNDLISLYGTLPLVSTNVKAVSARNEWLW
ncbi:Nucleotide-diphospho-sugar transferase [Sesbania bispinosa]|nr:Nucleotide-diphospho-sugar transferase [Sesbania bispinosa]